MSRATLAILAMLALVAPALAQTVSGKSAVTIVLGDSLSDDGNFYIEFTGRKCPNKTAGYFDGQFTNSPGVWTVQASAVNASTISTRNFAFAGATACMYKELNNTGGPYDGVPTLQEQVDRFNAKVAEPDFRRSLVGGGNGQPRLISAFIWGGHNDFLRALPLLSQDAMDGFPDKVSECINKTASMMLEDNGDLLDGLVIASLAPLDALPKGQELEKNLSSNGGNVSLSDMISQVNDNLMQIIDSLQQQYPNKTIELFDANNALASMAANATKYGFNADVTTPCLEVGPNYDAGACDVPKSKCDNPNDYFLFDDVHPSGKEHGLLGKAIIKFMVNNKLARPFEILNGTDGGNGTGGGNGTAGGRRLFGVRL